MSMKQGNAQLEIIIQTSLHQALNAQHRDINKNRLLFSSKENYRFSK